MDIKEVIYAKAAMEREILYFIQEKIAEFQGKTGVKIDDLKLVMAPVEGDDEKRKAAFRVNAIIIL
jgi:hypothetical protein